MTHLKNRGIEVHVGAILSSHRRGMIWVDVEAGSHRGNPLAMAYHPPDQDGYEYIARWAPRDNAPCVLGISGQLMADRCNLDLGVLGQACWRKIFQSPHETSHEQQTEMCF